MTSFSKALALGAGTGAALSLAVSSARTTSAQFDAAKQGALVGAGLVLVALLIRRATQEEA